MAWPHCGLDCCTAARTQPDRLAILAGEQEGRDLDEPEYHVVLHGKQVGPYSRRTIVGMRIRGTLGNDDAVLTSQGVQLTVSDLVKKRELDNTFQPDRSGTYSL